jgi:hypothetical protein
LLLFSHATTSSAFAVRDLKQRFRSQSVDDRRAANPDMFRAYLNKYPDGTYAELAHINIDVEKP